MKDLGKGAFGNVYLGIHKLTGRSVAIKTIDKEVLKDDYSRQKVLREIYISKKIKHVNVIRLLEVFETATQVMIVMEYAGGGDLLQYVKSKKRLSEAEARPLFKQIVYGLAHIHARNVLHRDIKPENILLDADGCVKICDFGVSRIIDKAQTINDQCGTPAYLAPEIIANQGYNGFRVDHWSLGVLLYAILCGSVPFKKGNIKDLRFAISEGKLLYPIKLSAEVRDLIKKLLIIEPTDRLSLPEVLEHPWLAVDKEGKDPTDKDFSEASDDNGDYNYYIVKNGKQHEDNDADTQPNINTLSIENLFYQAKSNARLGFKDYYYIANDFYTHHTGKL